MRIHALEITGFGPFKGTEKIDFDALTADHLFMLEGPTGAGKSSIIDAIVWVLYGQTAHQAAKKVNADNEVKEFVSGVLSKALRSDSENESKQILMLMTDSEYSSDVADALASMKPKVMEIIFDETTSETRLEIVK